MPTNDKEKKREYDEERHQKRKERKREYQRKYWQEHKEELNAKQRERDRKRREEHNEKQKARYWARREELLARRREQRKAQREKLRETQGNVEKPKPKVARPSKPKAVRTYGPRVHQRWMPVEGWEERYFAEEVGKYGPIQEDEQIRSPEELEELRRRVFAALDGKWEG